MTVFFLKEEFSSQERTDLLQVALETLTVVLEGHDSATAGHKRCQDIPSEQREEYLKRGVTAEEMMSQCALYLIAGTETPVTPLTVAASYLAKNPGIQARLKDEIDSCFTETDTEPSFEEINKLTYLNAVISEALRIHPPIARLERCVVEDITLVEQGIQLRKGMPVFVPLHALHHDPEFFPEPECFNPERFLKEDNDSILRYSYLPFGAGPRACIAMRFALCAMKVCLLQAVRNVEFVDPEKFSPKCRSESSEDELTELSFKVRRRMP
ncbi:cytochrome P450 3A19-like [Amblyomma americanum]